MAWEEVFGKRPDTLEAVSIRTGKKIIRSPTDGDVERVRRNVAAMVRELRVAMAHGRELPRTARPFCLWCPLLEDCAEGAAAVEILT